MASITDAKIFLTQNEVAYRFRVTPSTIKNWRERGLLHYFQAPGSRRVLYPIGAVEDLEMQSIKNDKEVMKEQGKAERKVPDISTKPRKEWKI